MAILEINQVSKKYKNGVMGLENVTFSVDAGVFGLVGHNGAGKTTLMRMISTIIRPTAGNISFMGYNTVKYGDNVRKNIGYLPQELTMYNNLSALDFVTYMARLKGIKNPKEPLEKLEAVGLTDEKNRKIGQLSGGMKRRVGIAQALVGNPLMIIVDEPTAGLDPEERVRFRGILSQYAKNDRVVLLSTHIVEDVYQLCEKLTVLRKGKLFFNGSSSKLIEQVHNKIKIIQLKDEKDLLSLHKQAVVIATTYNNGIFARIMDEHNRFTEPTVQETLEDAYIYCMGGKDHA